jgi:hypothetical protein
MNDFGRFFLVKAFCKYSLNEALLSIWGINKEKQATTHYITSYKLWINP